MFCEYAVKEIFVTPELRKFIEDGFITREEVRAKTQRQIARSAIGVSVAAVLVNVFFNLLNLYHQGKENRKTPEYVSIQDSKSEKNDVDLASAIDSCKSQASSDSIQKSSK